MTDEGLIRLLRSFEMVMTYEAADRIEELVKERDAIREAALREAYDVVHKWWFSEDGELPQELILALIGEKK